MFETEGRRMRKRLALAATVCLGVLLGTSCKSTPADYWPMAEGNLWIYRGVTIYAAPDSVDTMVTDDVMTWKCVSQVMLGNGHNAWAMSTAPGDTTYFEESGNAVLVHEDVSGADPDTWLSFPLEEGRSWSYYGGTMLVREKGTVEVPAGTYKNCWKIQMLSSKDQFQTFFWLAPNVGMVLMEMAEESGGYSYSIRTELTYSTVK